MRHVTTETHDQRHVMSTRQAERYVSGKTTLRQETTHTHTHTHTHTLSLTHTRTHTHAHVNKTRFSRRDQKRRERKHRHVETGRVRFTHELLWACTHVHRVHASHSTSAYILLRSSEDANIFQLCKSNAPIETCAAKKVLSRTLCL